MTGQPTEHTAKFADLTTREAWVVAPLIAVIVALGFFPKPLLDVINPAVDRTMQHVGVSDPEPRVPAAEGSGE
jgi:NADH-quinone oxidoreductase subunit M